MATTTVSYKKTGVFHHSKKSFDAKDNGKPRFKVGYIKLAATADDKDRTPIDIYEKFGMTHAVFVEGFIHTTLNSVIVEEIPIFWQEGFLVTIEVGGSTDNKVRFYAIYGF